MLERQPVRKILFPLGWAIAVFGFVTFGATLWDALQRNGGVGYDFASYWQAGVRFLHGEPLYSRVEINDPGAYRYMPTFAALVSPVSLMPELVGTWLYRLASLLCVRYLVGSWRATGWALLLPPVSIELMALNLTLPLAAAGRWALRGESAAAGLLPFAATLKYGSALLLPYVWLCQPDRRRALIVGLVAIVGITAVHAAVDPQIWMEFGASLIQQSQSVNDAPYVGDQLLFIVPSTLGDFLLRFALGGLMVVLAAKNQWAWLAFTAATIAVPTLWLGRLAPLIAVPRLWMEDRAARSRAAF